MGPGWRIHAVAAVVVALVVAACSSAQPDAQLVASRDGPDRVAVWRGHWQPRAEEFWAGVAAWRRRLTQGGDEQSVAVTAAAAPALVASLDRFTAAVTERDIPGDLREGAERLRAALVDHRQAWAALSACGPDPVCQGALVRRVTEGLPQVRSAQFDLRPR